MLENTPEKIKSEKINKFIIIAVILILGGTSCYFCYQFIKIKQDPQKVAKEEIKNLLAQISQIIVLPEGEEPTVATVTDPERLRDQPFFAKAKKGDKVLIYTNAKKAILYDPQNNKIVEVAPINIGGSQVPVSTNTSQ